MQGVDINQVGPRTNANNSASAYYLDRYIYGVLLLRFLVLRCFSFSCFVYCATLRSDKSDMEREERR